MRALAGTGAATVHDPPAFLITGLPCKSGFAPY